MEIGASSETRSGHFSLKQGIAEGIFEKNDESKFGARRDIGSRYRADWIAGRFVSRRKTKRYRSSLVLGKEQGKKQNRACSSK
jgi:hypothetical protein